MFLFFFALVLGGCAVVNLTHSIDLKDVDAEGTSPRLEREFKYSLKGEDLDSYDSSDLADAINEALEQSVDDSGLWEAPDFTETSYYVDDEALSFAYFDIYFDTEDNLNYENAISYRLRERFKSLKKYEKYIESQDKEKYWPFRIEFQAKVGREELGEGFSSVYESRFEFREESEPFSGLNPPPSPLWDLNEFIGYFQAGRFKNYYTWPAKAVVDYLMPDRTDKTELLFEPKLVLVTERQRQHLNLKTPWGSGPNPEQAFIVTLDISNVYDGPEYLEYLNMWKSDIEMPEPELKGKFTEIEVEFERNVSSELDKRIKEAEEQRDSVTLEQLGQVRDAFLSDQKTIMKVVKDYFVTKGIMVVPADKSKYLQAFELL